MHGYRLAVGLSILLAAAIQISSSSAREGEYPIASSRYRAPAPSNASDLGTTGIGFRSPAVLDTTVLGEWDFDPCSFEGWTSEDRSAQLDTFWQVTEDSGVTCLPSRVMWCGTRASSAVPYCSWDDLPGYGNGWEQFLVSRAFDVTGPVTWNARLARDTEVGFDYVRLQYDSSGSWTDRLVLDGQKCDTLVSVEIQPVGLHRTKLRFSFTSDTGFSDEDGFDVSEWGAVSVDDILVTSGSDTMVAPESWEDEPLGSHVGRSGPDTTWHAAIPDPVGDFVGIGTVPLDADPCRVNTTCQLNFITGSTLTNPDYPGIPVVPRDIHNHAISPMVTWPESEPTGHLQLHYDVYWDLPLSGAVFYNWMVRTYTQSSPGCPGLWRDRSLVPPFPPEKGWKTEVQTITDLIDPDPAFIQVGFSVVDLCDLFCEDYGLPGEPHTPSPVIDNVRLIRIETSGPVFSHRDLDFFQDTFPEDGSTTGVGRMDMANDINPQANPTIRPGDSLVLDASGPSEGGLSANPKMYVRVARGPHAGLSGASLEGTYGTFSSVVNGWTAITMDSARTSGGNTVEDVWAVDLNDSLFQAGDVLHYFFEATTNEGNTGLYTSTGRENDGGPDTSGGAFFEVSVLPTGDGDVLYVDAFHGRGAEPFFSSAFDQAGYGFDRYDVSASYALLGNSPAGRVKDLSQIQVYDKIVWGSGYLDMGTISDGTVGKANDAALLEAYLRSTPHDVGLWVSGDEVAYELSQSSEPAAMALLGDWCGVSYSSRSLYDLAGDLTPIVHAEPGSPWAAAAACSTHLAYGGCPLENSFDVLDVSGTGQYGFTWPGHDPAGGDPRGAVVYNSQPNDSGFTARTVFQAYSFHFIRDDSPGPVLDRTCFLDATLQWLGNTPGTPTPADEIPAVYSLAQNSPNPFNPATTIAFDLPQPGPVTLAIYDLAGRRVKILKDGWLEAGRHVVDWDGENEAGREVGSGVYFYRLEAGTFEARKKMVLLK
jgi:hypothetical protein